MPRAWEDAQLQSAFLYFISQDAPASCLAPSNDHLSHFQLENSQFRAGEVTWLRSGGHNDYNSGSTVGRGGVDSNGGVRVHVATRQTVQKGKSWL